MEMPKEIEVGSS
jgi:hypothetical protein